MSGKTGKKINNHQEPSGLVPKADILTKKSVLHNYAMKLNMFGRVFAGSKKGYRLCKISLSNKLFTGRFRVN